MTWLRTAVGTALATLFVAATTAVPQTLEERQDLAPDAFLEKLVGEWSVETEAVRGPGQDPVRAESREAARLLGGQWLVAESSGTTPGGDPVTSILTLGWNPAEEAFLGTWISSMQTHLWQYTGTLDDSGDVLTMETVGPILGDPTRTTQYREVIEIQGVDRRVTRSLILGPDGERFEFARAEYRRADRDSASSSGGARGGRPDGM
jgi:hypothetical protein